MDAAPAHIKCIINETRRGTPGVFQAGYREQIHPCAGGGEHGLRGTEIRLKNEPVLEYFSINIYERLIRKRDISFHNVGYFPVL